MALAIDTISDSFNQAKDRFFPIKKKFWLKLGFVSLLAGKPAANFGNTFNWNKPASMANVADFFRKYLAIIVALGVVGIVLGIFWGVIAFTFSFLFLEALLTGNILIKKGFSKHLKKGISLFFLNFFIGIINLILVAAVSLPIIIPLIKNWSNLSWSLFSIPYLVFFAIFFIADIFFFSILSFMINNFVFIDMYMKKNISALASFKRMLKLLAKEKKEFLLYLVMKVALGIVIGMISLIIFIITLIPLAILVIPIIIGLFFSFMIPAVMLKFTLVIFLGLLGVAIFFIWVYLVTVITVPLPSFMLLYAYNFVTKLNNRNSKLFI